MKIAKILALSSVLVLVMSSTALAHQKYRGSSHGYTETETIRTVTRGYDGYPDEVQVITRTHKNYNNHRHHHKKWNHKRRHRHQHHYNRGHSNHYEKHVTVYQSPRPIYSAPQYAAPAAQHYPSHDPVSGTPGRRSLWSRCGRRHRCGCGQSRRRGRHWRGHWRPERCQPQPFRAWSVVTAISS